MEISDQSQGRKFVEQELEAETKGGFCFDLHRRNEMIMKQLGSQSNVLPRFKKTGTTIVGVVYKDGVVLGADTRATGGSEVADKNCEKIHYLAPNIWCCGAGTAADTEKTTELIASNLELLRLSTGTQSRVVTALTLTKRMLYKYQGHVSAALVMGGVDVHGPHLYSIHPHGSTQRLPYTTMGSGSLAAMAVFESRFQEDMDEESATILVRDAIRAGIFNDLGSGSNVDITVIRKDGISRMRSYEVAAGDASEYRARFSRPAVLTPPAGSTFVISDSFQPHTIALPPIQIATTTAVEPAAGGGVAMEVA